MPEKETLERVRRDKRKGKSASSQAAEFVREEMHHIREGKHGARSSKQAIAIGLSKARRTGVVLAPPKKGQTSEKTRRNARRAFAAGRRNQAKSSRRSRATGRALRREGHSAATRRALSRQARSAARKRTRSHLAGEPHTFDCFECAIHLLAPECAHCGCKIIGHGVESNGVFYCCAHCVTQEGVRSEVRE